MTFDWSWSAFSIIVAVVVCAAIVEAFFAYRLAWKEDIATPTHLHNPDTETRIAVKDDQAPYGSGTSLHL